MATEEAGVDLALCDTYDVNFIYNGFTITVPDVVWDDPDAEKWVDDDVLIDKARQVLNFNCLPTDYDKAEVH